MRSAATLPSSGRSCRRGRPTPRGCVPEEILYDRMKTAVIGEDEAGVVTYNASLVALLNHYGAAPRACRPYRAQTKGKIERPYRYIRQDFFLARTFVRRWSRTHGANGSPSTT